MTLITRDIQKAIKYLNQEQLVAIPTETVYGLSGNIYSKKAIKSIFKMKQRPLFNPLIVHIHSIDQLQDLVEYIPDNAQKLANKFWPGSLTLVLKKNKNVPDSITAGKDTVAIRIPNHPLTLELLKNLDFPLAAPSANPFGSISPTNALHVAEYFNKSLPMVLDGGDCKNGIESTIIGFENEEAVLYRVGAISIELIEQEIGTIIIKNTSEKSPDAPGMLSRHYAPKTTTYLTDNIEEYILKYAGKKIGLLVFDTVSQSNRIQHQEILSKNGDLTEAASNLYAALHRLDKKNLDVILAQTFPNYGLGKSINDRLQRATKK